MEKDIPVQEWLDKGYRRYEVAPNNRELNKLASFMLQKRLDDEKGKKYFITVYCYDRKNYPDYMRNNMPEIGYMPTAHFSLRDDRPFFNIEMNAPNSVEEAESYFELFWETLNNPYYEEWTVD